MNTGIFIRVWLKPGEVENIDIGDPRLPLPLLIGWLAEQTAKWGNRFMVRLIVTLLGRGEELDELE